MVAPWIDYNKGCLRRQVQDWRNRLSLIFLFRVSFRMINNLVQSLMYIEFVGLKKYKEHENDSFWIFVYWVDFSVNVVFFQYNLDKA